MLWAACCLGFLKAGEFTTSWPLDPSTHRAVSDVQANTLVNPTSFKIHIEHLKTDPFEWAMTSMWAKVTAAFAQ